jgi:hypothetical protein
MNRTFDQADDNGKLTIAEFMAEEKLGVSIDFKPIAGEFFKKNYRDIYKNWLLDATSGNCLYPLVAKIIGVKRNRETIQVVKLQYYSGDATTYDDSGYEVFTCPSYPKGIVMTFPIFLIKKIETVGKRIY